MKIRIDDLNINYEVYGEGKPLLLLHGWMCNINTLAIISNYFKENRKVIVLDFPSQGGKSDRLLTPWGVPEYSEMVYKFIKELNLESVDVLGHSFGGRVIIYLASKYKDLFDKIILVDSAGVKPKKSLKKIFKMYSYKLARHLLKLVTPKNKYEEKLAKLRAKYSSGDYSQISLDVERETFKNIINLDLTDNLSDILRPTLIMWGADDNDTPVYMARIMEKEIKDAGLVILANAGHYSFLDKPTEFLKITDTFLKGDEK